MNAAELAALIAAVSFALLVCVGIFVLVRLGRFLSEGTRLVADVRERGDVLLRARRRLSTGRRPPWTGPAVSLTAPSRSRPAWTNSGPG